MPKYPMIEQPFVQKDLKDYIEDYRSSPAYGANLTTIYRNVHDFTNAHIEEMINKLSEFLLGWSDDHADEAHRRISYLERLLNIRRERKIKT